MKLKIKELADIRMGYQFRGRVENAPEAPYPVIQIKDLDEARRLDSSNLARVETHRDPRPYMAAHGDVLFLSRGHHPFATTLETPPPNAIVSGYFFIVRAKQEQVLPAYLAWYLNQQPFQTELRPVLKGTHMPMVALRDFVELHVEVPPIAVQESIVMLEALRSREQELLTQMREKRNELVQSVSLKAVRRSSSGRRI